MTATCTKCHGTGTIACYGHIEHGRCFRCLGTGTRMTAEERSRLQAARDAKRIAAHNARVAKMCGLSVEEFLQVAQG